MMSDETESPSSSGNDLEILSSARKELALGSSGSNESVSFIDRHSERSYSHANGFIGDHAEIGRSGIEQNSTSKAQSRNKEGKSGIRIAWSDDEDSDRAYKSSRKKKLLKRKRETALTSIVKQRKGASRTETSKLLGSGSRTRPDDQAEEIPDYLMDRRARFEKRKAVLKEAGLRLPPSYENVDFSDEEHLESLEEKPVFPEKTPPGPYKDRQLPHSLGLIPAPVAQWLRDYQLQGVAFLHKLFVYQTGGILGDDMGLGKTVQVIAFLTAAFGKTGDERDDRRMRKMRRVGVKWYPRTLVVCPGTLISNWRAEFDRWGWWHVDVYHGSAKDSVLQAATTGRVEVLITTYTTYRTNKSAINCISWDCVVADECHHIKGRDSETTKAMNEVNALCRVGLTGTAIQNNYEELWTLLNWANPGKIGSLASWKVHISEPLKTGQAHGATEHQLGRARKTAQALVNNLLSPFFLRRMKSLIADQLPKKSDRVVFCPLTDMQANAYSTFLDSEDVQIIQKSSESCDCGSKKKAGWCCHTLLTNGEKWQTKVFPTIHYLQKMANHLAILIPDGTDPVTKQEKDLETLQAALPDRWRELYRTRGSILNYSNSNFCGKWKVLKKLLAYWHTNGDKVLIFSHSKRLLRMFRLLFQNTSYSVSYLDGTMSYEERAKEVDDFNADNNQFVFLISTKAGGVGLNITSANKVVILDPNWNPSWDLQAQDRAYRIGQWRNVEVFRLISAGTIEENVYARQIYKQQQANIGYTASTERRYFTGIQDNVAQKGEIFGLQNMFTFAKDGVVLRDIVHKTNVAEARAGVSVKEVDLSEFDSSFDTNNPRAGRTNAGDDPLLAGDNEDSAMSQLAEIIAAEDPEAAAASYRKKKVPATPSDPVQAILAGAGVSYSHENSEVVGSSRIEAHLSRRALEAGNDIDEADARIFLSEDETTTRKRGHDDGCREPAWRYRPPVDVMRRQFCTMAREFGFEDATEFALVVEGWTAAQRRTCLDRFYGMRKRALGLHKTDHNGSVSVIEV